MSSNGCSVNGFNLVSFLVGQVNPIFIYLFINIIIIIIINLLVLVFHTWQTT